MTDPTEPIRLTQREREALEAAKRAHGMEAGTRERTNELIRSLDLPTGGAAPDSDFPKPGRYEDGSHQPRRAKEKPPFTWGDGLLVVALCVVGSFLAAFFGNLFASIW